MINNKFLKAVGNQDLSMQQQQAVFKPELI